MQNNSLTNLNNNKILQDKLNTQIATEKKISRPSEDPVIAIRALRLRTNLSEVTQYLEKNVEDAEGWLSATEDALSTMNDVLQSMYAQCEKGNDDSLTSENRAAIMEQLKGLRDEVYATGDADYAGRTLFTGYRTNESLRFKENTVEKYSISDVFTKDDMDTITYIDTGDLKDITATSLGTTTEQDVKSASLNRILLSYDTLSNTDGIEITTTGKENGSVNTTGDTISIDGISVKLNPDGSTDINSTTGGAISVTVNSDDNTLSVTAGDQTYVTNFARSETGAYVFKNEVEVKQTYAVTTMSSGSTPNPYNAIQTGNYAAILIPETGELLLSDATKNSLEGLSAKDTISITYEKENWEKGDLRPEHYFKCTQTTADGKILDYSGEAQYMEYDVGYNQKMRVNTLASEAFTHDIGRTVDDMMQASQDVVDMEATITKLKAMADDGVSDQDQVNAKLDAANKALTFLKEKEKKLYAGGMTAMQGYMAQTNLATTNLGNRDSRLALIKTRLTSQQTNFKGLVNENEGADVSEVAVELKSAETAYDAALMATSKIIQNSLMNYI